MSRYDLCDRCTIRNCKRTPKAIKHGIYKCHKRRELKDGWPMLELLLDTSPAEVMELAHRYGRKVTEAKKGYRFK